MELAYYQYHLAHLHTAKKKGVFAPHKAILMLTVMDLISRGSITSPEIFLNEELIERFKQIWHEKIPTNFPFKCDIGQPFYHLQHEAFWRLMHFDEEYNTLSEELGLHTSQKKEKAASYAISALRKKFRCARIDQELFECLQDSDARECLRKILVENYCTLEF